MANTSTRNSSGLPSWLIHLAKWLAKTQAVVIVLIVSVVLNIVAALFFLAWPLSKSSDIVPDSPMKWVLDNRTIFLLCTAIVFLIAVIIFLVGKFDVSPSDTKIRFSYLSRLIQENERLTLSGIPVGIVAKSVPLDEVFILPQLKHNRPLTDYPLSEEQLENLRENLKQGTLSEEIQQILIESERNWYRLPTQYLVSIIEFWRHLTRKNPATVIQGYPGMGKSTLLARLALHMARRSLGYPDPQLDIILDPPCIPILIRLGAYAIECEHVREHQSYVSLSLADYLRKTLAQFHVPGVEPWLLSQLQSGQCLVLLDGLDEVSNLQMRRKIQEEITTFIHDYQDQYRSRFNRFIITSRVAGYDQAAFPDYPHYTVAELTTEQIDRFLSRWCHVSVREDRNIEASDKKRYEQVVINEAEQMASRLKVAVAAHPGVRELAENPLLLTLLVVMQQNSTELPRRRVELYSVVTRTLLENRNIAKGLIPISELLTIERLGPLALVMQGEGNSFAQQKDVMASLKQAILKEGGTEQDAVNEARYFLERLRERGGIFVLRTGDYFSFFHRTFQEYFTARHILHLIETDPDKWLVEFINRVRSKDDLWREPFLLAVAYKSGENKVLVCQIISLLLASDCKKDFEVYLHNLLLAAECVIESKPFPLDPELEKNIAIQLLSAYKDSLQNQNFSASEKIEAIISRWLLSLPKDAFHPAILKVLSDALCHTEERRYALVLLLMIVKQLLKCYDIVFDLLIPLLLSLAKLPASGKHTPTPLSASDSASAALSLSLLFFMGKKGPAVELLNKIREQLKNNLDQTYSLVEHSIRNRILLLPIVPPKKEESYSLYIIALDQWYDIVASAQKTFEKKKVLACVALFNDLLDLTEEVDYPCAVHFTSLASNQLLWQSYLEQQMELSSIEQYQDLVSLWITFFPRDIVRLVTLVERHINENETDHYYASQNFLAMLGYNLLFGQAATFLEEASTSLNEQPLIYQAMQNLRNQIVEQTSLIEKYRKGSRARKAPKFIRAQFLGLAENVKLVRQNLQMQLSSLERQSQQAQLKQLSQKDLRILYYHRPLLVMRAPQALQNQGILQSIQLYSSSSKDFNQLPKKQKEELFLQLYSSSSKDFNQLPKKQKEELFLLETLHFLFTQKVSYATINRLSNLISNRPDRIDEIANLIFILYGRIFHLKRTKEIYSDTIVQEIQRIAQVVNDSFPCVPPEDLEICLRIIQELPPEATKEDITQGNV